MVRTQIYIPEELHSKAKLVAKQKNISFAELLRGYIEQGLYSMGKEDSDSLDAIAGLNLKGGPKDLSKNIDKYIYA